MKARAWDTLREVAWKELRSEWRSRHALWASVLFAVVTLVVVTVSMGPAAARSEGASFSDPSISASRLCMLIPLTVDLP